MKIAVFIDGSNLYSKFKELKIKNTSRFNFLKFILKLTKGISPSYIGYYVGQIRREKNNDKSEALYKNQQKFFTHLKSTLPNIQIVRGHIQNFNEIYKEKGVDVRLALDIYKLANEKIYQKALLVSSDTDLIPAIRLVKQMKKQIEYIGFSHHPSLAMVKECSSSLLMNHDDMKVFENNEMP
ncbi:NYN domain-containing protein [Candidatus Peregrinibacteria bacterium]|nr:NYN domain-containing protein [Candidatus Peregrinibacteria bacterium]